MSFAKRLVVFVCLMGCALVGTFGNGGKSILGVVAPPVSRGAGTAHKASKQPVVPFTHAKLTSGPSYEATIESEDPDVYYPLNDASSGGSAADDSGNGITGTSASPVAATSAPMVSDTTDDSLEFGYSNALGMTASDSSLPSGGSDRTVEIWERTYGCCYSNYQLLSYGNAGNSFSILMQTQALEISDGTTDVVLDTPVYLEDENWHQIDITFGGSVATLYVDGQNDDSESWSTSTSLGAGFEIGQTGSMSWGMSVADAAVFPTVLTRAQVDRSEHHQCRGHVRV